MRTGRHSLTLMSFLLSACGAAPTPEPVSEPMVEPAPRFQGPPEDVMASIEEAAARVAREVDCRESTWRYVCAIAEVGRSTPFEVPSQSMGWPAVHLSIVDSWPVVHGAASTSQVAWFHVQDRQLLVQRVAPMTAEQVESTAATGASLGNALRGGLAKIGVDEALDSLLADPYASDQAPEPIALMPLDGTMGADGEAAHRLFTVTQDTRRVHVLAEVRQGGIAFYLAPDLPRVVGAVEGQ